MADARSDGRIISKEQIYYFKTYKKYFEEGELEKNYNVDFYNLDVIIFVGYRVKSQKGVQFRIWATNILTRPISTTKENNP